MILLRGFDESFLDLKIFRQNFSIMREEQKIRLPQCLQRQHRTCQCFYDSHEFFANRTDDVAKAMDVKTTKATEVEKGSTGVDEGSKMTNVVRPSYRDAVLAEQR